MVQIIDKMEAAGLIEKVETPRPLRFNFTDVTRLPPPIIAFTDVAFSYSGKKEDYLYKKLNFGIEYVFCLAALGGAVLTRSRGTAWTRVLRFWARTVPESRRCLTSSRVHFSRQRVPFQSTPP